MTFDNSGAICESRALVYTKVKRGGAVMSIEKGANVRGGCARDPVAPVF